MDSLALIFSASGRIAPKPFAVGALLLYALIFLSQALLSPPLSVRAGVVPFVVAQAVLAWVWYALHAKRLRDAGLGTGSALGIAVTVALSLVLFLLLLQVLFGASVGASADDRPGGLAPFVIVLFLLTLLTSEPSISFFFYVALVIVVIMFTPLLIALGFSIWAGTRPGIASGGPASGPSS
jgi:uncharacterized membrane protein YhaH (DUF805 family)